MSVTLGALPAEESTKTSKLVLQQPMIEQSSVHAELSNGIQTACIIGMAARQGILT